jgi:hypothetical protein
MKNSEKPASEIDSNDIEFPDWSGMDDSSPRLSAEAAFRLSEQYPGLFRKHQLKPDREDSIKCGVEFVL